MIFSEEAFQIAEKRREVKGKGERERYTQLNTGSQIIIKRDKNAIPTEQCNEIEENNRMGKTGDLLKTISDIPRICHAEMGKIKDINGRA